MRRSSVMQLNMTKGKPLPVILMFTVPLIIGNVFQQLYNMVDTIIADTKFEFGLDENGNLVIGDEMLTPDSSRFWPAEGYEPGHGQPSFDKQFARDWLKANPDNDWTLPQEIVDKTIEKYLQAYKMLTGKDL